MKQELNLLAFARQKYIELVNNYTDRRDDPATDCPIGKYPRWTDHFLRPVLAELFRLTPEVAWECPDTLIPLGLRGDCSIFGHHIQNGRTVGITFSYNAETQVLSYDTGLLKNRYAKGTLGDLNRFNHVTAPAESMDDLVWHIRRQSMPLDALFDFITVGARVQYDAGDLTGEFTVKHVKYSPDGLKYSDSPVTLTDGTRDFIAYPEELNPIV